MIRKSGYRFFRKITLDLGAAQGCDQARPKRQIVVGENGPLRHKYGRAADRELPASYEYERRTAT